MSSPTEAWREAVAEFPAIRAAHAVEHVDVRVDGHRLAESGFWVIVGDFEGRIDAWRFADVSPQAGGRRQLSPASPWSGPSPEEWTTSLDQTAYERGVNNIRNHIRAGDVYQVNLCRVLTAPLSASQQGPDLSALAHCLDAGNPAPHSALISIPGHRDVPGRWMVSASPELFLEVDEETVRSSPIKGTAAVGESMLDKDQAENVMITDLVRNDLSHVAKPGTVRVPEFLREHAHPGLVHLQSTIEADLDERYCWTPDMWGALVKAALPAGSVSGAPKSTALEIIAAQEPVPRGPYCGVMGWVDADSRRASLAVGIRTFWWDPHVGGTLNFGTGAGITWGSDPALEWRETELKASRLVSLASGATIGT